MTDFVLDASATAGWLFEDEATAAGDALLRELRDVGAVVPVLWHFEIANIVRNGERRQRVLPAKAESFILALSDLPIVTDTEDPDALRGRAFALARRHNLTAYDATYLDLAIRRHLPLATRDADLKRAATADGVALLDS